VRTISFEFIKQRTAWDLRTVAKLLEDAATKCEKGDLDQAEEVIFGRLAAWNEDLALRLAFLKEKKGQDLDIILAQGPTP
jgi:hypothetical protein